MIRLELYDPDENCDCLVTRRLSIGDYLIRPPEWEADTDETLLIFSFLSDNQNDSLNPFGILDFIYPQFEEALWRLESDRFALLRSATESTPFFLIFEPENDDIYVSILGSLDPPFSSYYPCKKSPFFTSKKVDQRAELYAFVEANRYPKDALFLSDSTLLRTLQNVQIPKQECLRALKREVAYSLEFIAKRKHIAI